MKILPALPSLAAACALCACGAYVNPCGSGSPNNLTCPVQGGGSSSSSSSSGGSSSGSSSGAAGTAQSAFSIAGATYFEGAGAAPAAQALRGTVRRIGAAGRWPAAGAAQTGEAGLELGTGALRLQLSREGWQYRDLGAGGAQAQGQFAPALEAGTGYWFDLALGADRRTLTLTLPGGSVQIDDPAAPAQLGSDAAWQALRAVPAAGAFDFAAVWAAEDGQAALPAAVYKAYDPAAAGQ